MTAAGEPLLAPAQAAVLLDQVVYEQVLECIDFDALSRVEQQLIATAGDVPDVTGDHATTLARAMIDRALLRIPADLRRYLRASDWLDGERCEICIDDRLGERAASPPPAPHSPG